MKTSKIHVIKFGGTSLKNERYIKQATKIVDKRNKEAQLAVVVSAIDGVTDSLINLAEHPGRFELIDKIEQRHFDLYHKLSANRNGEYISLKQLFDELRQVVQDEDLRSINFSAWKDHILSFGERAVAVIFSAVLSAHSVSSEPVMAFKIIKTNSRFNEARVDREQSRQLIRRKLARMSALPVITGFIGSDKNGAITTLGRSGSDYTAGLIAGALDAERLEIWTDVDGVLSADPRWVPGAKNISELSFADIEELSAHGANVIHPKTIKPVRNCSTSVIIKNSYNPSHAGTAIKRNFPSNGSLKTITLTGPFVQLKIDDKDTFRLLEELKSLSANWADTFSFKRSSSFEAARFLIDQPFFNLKEPQLLQWTEENDIHFEIKKELYKVKKFSNCFNDNEQLMSRIWNLLISRDLQPLQVERNSSDRFASFLFSKKEALRAARLFDTYLQNDKKIIDIFIAGNGAVGSTLLQQLRNLKAKDIEFRLLGICNSKKCLWNEKG
ncbi:MAG TPA: aspartate kinase, partial [Balneolaceae bacterium]|nr:aspartate kinase [Balneolaceae bacterium]